MTGMATTERSRGRHVGILSWPVFAIAAVLSTATTIVLFGFLALGGIVVTVFAAPFAFRGRSRRATVILSAALGLLVGPALYVLLALVVALVA